MSAFPTLLIDSQGLHPQGTFAVQQAAFLDPDDQSVRDLDDALQRTKSGVVAHFYMDAELQGVLYDCVQAPVQISDSLAMADKAIEMAEEGIENVVVLGVDFMAENVRAMLSDVGHTEIGVYRVADARIGCSLADAAESDQYYAYLQQASKQGPALHVIYINTSLETKARAHCTLPTITCTSSNVVQTVLTAFAQVPDLQVFFGPDTYMGSNLAAMFAHYAQLPADKVKELHPEHTPESMAALAKRFHYFQQGTCIVHHMFGGDVAQRVKESYDQAHIAAHLEVPGEMFALAAKASLQGRGVAGSTSDILRYILKKLDDAAPQERVSVVLGTEAGMVTSIVRKVKAKLAESKHQGKELEIIFPVASQAVAAGEDESLPMIPGVAAGEGCSTAGGCATCPYMKMNSLDALEDLLSTVAKGETPALAAFEPKAYEAPMQGKSVAHWGKLPIVEMRAFQKEGRLSAALVERLSQM